MKPHPLLSIAISVLGGETLQCRTSAEYKHRNNPLGQHAGPWEDAPEKIEADFLTGDMHPGYEWRIKPPGLRGRMAVIQAHRYGKPYLHVVNEDEGRPDAIFVRWIDDDWKEYAPAE